MIDFDDGFLDTGGVDLHTHSLASDGQLKPAELISRAESQDLKALALTDHDTVAGVDEFMEAGRTSPLTVIPGVEISCRSGENRYHLLGYYVDWENERLRQKLNFYEEARADRVRGMLDVLEEETGERVPFDEVSRRAGGGLIGKPHVAQVMLDRGIVDSVDEAFTNYLAHGQPLDRVPKKRMGLSEAINIISETGGVPVLAHPLHYDEDLNLGRLKSLGLRGIEVFYSDHSREDSHRFYEMARSNDLAVTGGSDFHGSVKPEVDLGDVRVSTTIVEPLANLCRQAGGRFDLYSS